MLFLYYNSKDFLEIAKIFHGLKIMMEDIFSTYSYGCLTFHSMSRQLLHSFAYEQTYVTLIFCENEGELNNQKKNIQKMPRYFQDCMKLCLISFKIFFNECFITFSSNISINFRSLQR